MPAARRAHRARPGCAARPSMKPVRHCSTANWGGAVGLWAETIQDDVRSTLLPIIGLIVGCLVLSIALSIILASKTIRPISGSESDRRRYQPRPSRYFGNDSIQRRGRRIGPVTRKDESELESSDDSLEPRIGRDISSVFRI